MSMSKAGLRRLKSTENTSTHETRPFAAMWPLMRATSLESAAGSRAPYAIPAKIRKKCLTNTQTLAVAYDTIVDGVLRKAHSYVAKTVSVQTNRKIDTEKFLCKTGKHIIDTEITVTPLLDVVMTQDGGPETFGTMEHRLYITRRLGVSHVNNVKKYYEIRSDVEGDHSDDTDQKASFKLISPTLKMSLERNTAPLEGTQPSLHKRRADAKRPGSEPWAIFRFHYRSEG